MSLVSAFAQMESEAAASLSPGRRRLYVMPHCPVQLYERVIALHWQTRALGDIAIIGNSFKMYEV